MRYTEAEKHLCELLEWAKGNRGRKDVNPYAIPEVKQALKYLAKRQGFKNIEQNYFDAETTAKVSESMIIELEKEC